GNASANHRSPKPIAAWNDNGVQFGHGLERAVWPQRDSRFSAKTFGRETDCTELGTFNPSDIAAIESCSCKHIGGARQVRCSDAFKTEKANPLWIHYLV